MKLKWRHLVAPLLLILIALPVPIVLYNVWRQEHLGSKKLARLSTLNASDIDTILVWDLNTEQVLATVTDKSKQSEFLGAMSRVDDWQLQQPAIKRLRKKYFVVLTSTSQEVFEFELYFNFPFDHMVYIEVIRTDRNLAPLSTGRKSAELSAWLDSLSSDGR